MERHRASFFLDEGEEEEAYFFFSCVCSTNRQGREWGAGLLRCCWCFVDLLVQGSATQRNNEKPVFPDLFST